MPPSSTSVPTPTLEHLHVTVWEDPLVDRLGHDPRSCYTEQFWLPILGPSTVWLLRRCADLVESHPDGATLDLADTASSIGVGHKGGRNSPLARSIVRACRFGAARSAGSGELQVRRFLPPLTLAQVDRLPDGLRAAHARHTAVADDELERRRARRLALGLVQCGDGLDAAERQLDRWRFSPAVAAEAVRWAWDLHGETAA